MGPVIPENRKMSVIAPEKSFGFSGHFENSKELWINHTV